MFLGLALALGAPFVFFAALTRLVRNSDGTVAVQSLDNPTLRTSRNPDGTVTVEN